MTNASVWTDTDRTALLQPDWFQLKLMIKVNKPALTRESTESATVKNTQRTKQDCQTTKLYILLELPVQFLNIVLLIQDGCYLAIPVVMETDRK